VVAPATAPLPQSAASIEERLVFLHAGLKITDAQAVIWDLFAEEVRKSLDAIEVLRGGKGDGQPLMLPEKVAAWEMDQMSRLDAQRQLAAVIAPFYADLSDRQKRTADVLLLTILGVM
jgi:LTXXQ motif family protein